MSPARSRLRPPPAVPPCGRCPAIVVRHPETDAGSAGEQPARDTGVAADDARRGSLAAHAPGRRNPGTPPIGVAPCLRKPWGRRPQGVRGQSPLSSQRGGRPQGGQPFPLPPPGAALTPRRNCKLVVLQLIRHPSPDLTGKTEACWVATWPPPDDQGRVGGSVVEAVEQDELPVPVGRVTGRVEIDGDHADRPAAITPGRSARWRREAGCPGARS